MNPFKILLSLCLSLLFISPTQAQSPASKLHKETFEHLDNWIVEMEPPGTLSIKENQLTVDSPGGVTIWFKHPIQAPCRISYTVIVHDNGGANDRVSDINTFVMASDPKDSLFLKTPSHRTGKFTDYHTLYMYYVGYAANNNSTIRFRRYDGNFNRPLLPEHDLKGSMKGNTPMHIEIEVKEEHFSYKMNGQEIYNYKDSSPLSVGYFGFRTVTSHQSFQDFQIETW